MTRTVLATGAIFTAVSLAAFPTQSPPSNPVKLFADGSEPPSAFRSGTPPAYFDIETTAQFIGSVRICLDHSAISFTNERKMRLFHFEDGGWVDRTVSVDTDNDVVCAQASSLGLFAPFEFDVVDVDIELSETKLIASDGGAGDALGWAGVSVDSGTFVVSTPFQARFGRVVAIDGDTLFTSARFKDEVGVDSGAAYVFARTAIGWTEVAKLVGADTLSGDTFGVAMELDGDLVAPGATLSMHSNPPQAGEFDAFMFALGD